MRHASTDGTLVDRIRSGFEAPPAVPVKKLCAAFEKYAGREPTADLHRTRAGGILKD
jgi:hypothetical protein